MKTKHTRRGFTQETKKAVNKKQCHSRGILSAVSLIPSRCSDLIKAKALCSNNEEAGDPRLQHSGMTPLFNTPLPRLTAVLSQRGKGFLTPPYGPAGHFPRKGDRPYGTTAAYLPQGGQKTTRGFTLIELLVVVLIIGLLAAVALPQYNKAVKKTKGTEVLETAAVLDKALTSYYLTNGNYRGNSVVSNFSAGPSSEELDVQMPELKYFDYALDGGLLRRSSTFQVGCIVSPAIHRIVFREKNDDVEVVATNRDGGKMELECRGKNGPIEHCGDYFNCQWENVVWSPCSDPTQPGCPIITTKYCYLN